MTNTEYLVTWKREGLKPKRKRYCSFAAARRLVLLLGPEPWLAYGKGPGDDGCSHGYHGHESEPCCPAFGETMAQRSERERREMPPLEWIRLSDRDVSQWRVIGGEGA